MTSFLAMKIDMETEMLRSTDSQSKHQQMVMASKADRVGKVCCGQILAWNFL